MERISNALHHKHLRALFYLVTPNETTYSSIDEVPNILRDSIPWMLVLMTIEFIILDRKKWAFNDTVTSINSGILSLLFKFGGKSVSAYFYTSLYNQFHIVTLPGDSVYTWGLCFLTQDLLYYLAHRAMHEAGWFWGLHQMHHSSEYYNLGTALRKGAFQDLGLACFELLQAVIIPPPVFLVHRYLNFIFQFWIHTELVPKLGPLEYFINTPSSHRVHHGNNPYCIDKNYAAVLIIWDRLFGTYAEERPTEEIAYGLVTSVGTFDQLWCQFFEFKALIYDKGQLKNEKGKDMFPGFWNKVKAACWPPGYFPGSKTKRFFWWRCMENPAEGIPEVNYPVEVFNPPLSLFLGAYLLFNFVVFSVISLSLIAKGSHLNWTEYLLSLTFVIGMMQKFGYYFDHRSFAIAFDAVLIIATTFCGFIFAIHSLVLFGLANIFMLFLLRRSGQIGADTLKVE